MRSTEIEAPTLNPQDVAQEMWPLIWGASAISTPELSIPELVCRLQKTASIFTEDQLLKHKPQGNDLI